jgi:Fic family protein
LSDLEDIYDTVLLDHIELYSIEIDNLLEIKSIEETILIEFAKDFIFNSNRIEGSKIPESTVRRLLEQGTSDHKDLNEVKEVLNSIEAFNYIQSDFRYNLQSVKRLYHILTKDLVMPNGDPYPKGFKTMENVVNEMTTTPPEMVEEKLKELLQNYKASTNKFHPLKLAFDTHLEYERIHPFIDGNGRTGRLLMNKILMSGGYFPMIIYSSNTEAYYNSIRRGINGNIKVYYQFMLKQMRRTYKKYKKIIEDY